LKRIEALLFPYLNNVSLEANRNKVSSLNLRKRIDFLFGNEAFSFLSLLEEIKRYIIEEINLEKKGLLAIDKLNIREEKLLVIKGLEKNLSEVLTVIHRSRNDTIFLKYYENIYRKYFTKTLLEKEITTVAYYKLLLNLNKYKFEDILLLRLSPLISKLYNKKVEFNIVNLKAVSLNSDIFTQAIALKLRNRDNKLLTVLRYFLYMIKLPKINLLKERFAYVNIKTL
jgi:hypothetical protein